MQGDVPGSVLGPVGFRRTEGRQGTVLTPDRSPEKSLSFQIRRKTNVCETAQGWHQSWMVRTAEVLTECRGGAGGAGWIRLCEERGDAGEGADGMVWDALGRRQRRKESSVRACPSEPLGVASAHCLLHLLWENSKFSAFPMTWSTELWMYL